MMLRAEPTPYPGTGAGRAGAALVVCAALLALAALVLPREATSDVAPVDDPATVAFNIPPLVAVVLAALLAGIGLTRAVAAVFALLFGAWTLVEMSATALLAVSGEDRLAAGAWASIVGAVTAVIGGVLLARGDRIGLRRDRWNALSSGIGLGLAGLWLYGEWLAWEQTRIILLDSDRVWSETGTTELVQTCCLVFRDTTMPGDVRELLRMGLMVVAAAVLPWVGRSVVAGLGMVALAGLYASDGLSWLSRLAETNPDPVKEGVSPADAAEVSTVVVRSGLAGGWIALAACAGLVLLGGAVIVVRTRWRSPGVLERDGVQQVR